MEDTPTVTEEIKASAEGTETQETKAESEGSAAASADVSSLIDMNVSNIPNPEPMEEDPPQKLDTTVMPEKMPSPLKPEVAPVAETSSVSAANESVVLRSPGAAAPVVTEPDAPLQETKVEPEVALEASEDSKVRTDDESKGDDTSCKSSTGQTPVSRQKSGGRGDMNNLPTRQYLDSTVVPILLQGLSHLAKTRPVDPIQELSNYLLQNKTKYDGTETNMNGGT